MKIAKTTLLLAGASLFLSAGISLSQAQSVSTDPVGYVTLDVKGTGGVVSERFSYIAVSLQNPTSVASVVESFSANSIVIEADLTPSDFASGYYVEVTSGDDAGVTATILGNTTNELTTNEDLTSFLAVDATVSIKKYVTISDVFGATNENGLLSGSTLSAADQILLSDGEGGFDRYFYLDGARASGWRESSDLGSDAADTPIPVGTAIIVRCVQEDDVSVVFSGSVLSTPAAIYPIELGYNYVSTAFPVDYSLNELFGTDGGALTSSGSIAGADEVIVVNGSGEFETYFFLAGARSSGWRNADDLGTDVGDEDVVLSGSALIINRKASTAFNFSEAKPY